MEYRGQHYTFDAGARLGSGGMAEVYLGTRRDDPSIHVAIKVPAPNLDAAAKALFLREAQAASQVSSPYVVQVVDWGDQPGFIAFDYIAGGTLAEELRNYLTLSRGDRRSRVRCL